MSIWVTTTRTAKNREKFFEKNMNPFRFLSLMWTELTSLLFCLTHRAKWRNTTKQHHCSSKPSTTNFALILSSISKFRLKRRNWFELASNLVCVLFWQPFDCATICSEAHSTGRCTTYHFNSKCALPFWLRPYSPIFHRGPRRKMSNSFTTHSHRQADRQAQMPERKTVDDEEEGKHFSICPSKSHLISHSAQNSPLTHSLTLQMALATWPTTSKQIEMN